MNPNSDFRVPQTVVFDLGGVLAEISHSWQEAATVAGVEAQNLGPERTPLAAYPGFDQYQAGAITVDEYLAGLADFVGCPPENALCVHNGILVVENPGVKEIVDELLAKGVRTGCLSNTNAPHWEYLALNGDYPAIHALEMKMASHLVGLSKPSPEIFTLYCEQFKIEPSDIAYFDDYQVNVDAAVASGWNACRIDPANNPAAQIRAYLEQLGVLSVNAIA